MVFDEAGSLEGAIDNPFRIELSAGAETLGIHLRWLPRARIEIPFRDCRRATASRSANPATINVPSRLETNLITAPGRARMPTPGHRARSLRAGLASPMTHRSAAGK
jgi:hypothetical protein